MGFSEQVYPSLNTAIDAHLPPEHDLSTEKENDVVGEVIEDLLGDESVGEHDDRPGPSSSGPRQADFWL